jgi:Ssp1 endopeptidase immunity protein Rap1a
MQKAIMLAMLLSCGTAWTSDKDDRALAVASQCGWVRTIVLQNGQFAMQTTFATGSCWGRFAAVQDFLSAIDEKDQRPLLGVCIPNDVSRIQLIKVYVRYVDEHPEKGHLFFFPVLMESMAKAFTCAK